MSKIGMRPIAVGSVKIVEQGQGSLKFEKNGLTIDHELPDFLQVSLDSANLTLSLKEGFERDKKHKETWGLHRALIANKIKGIDTGFTSTIRMVGLSYKALLQGSQIVFSLGFSHKVDVPLDPLVSVEIDKTGQLLTLKSNDKFRLGNFCAKIRSLKNRDPYKGTGIFLNNEVLLRKAGKSKS